MLPQYTFPQLTLGHLTDDVMDAALDHFEFPDVFPTDIARQAVIQVLSYNMIWDAELTAYSKAACEFGSVEGEKPGPNEIFNEISRVAKYAMKKLQEEESAKYAAAFISPAAVARALCKANVTCEVPAMRTFLGDLAVGGEFFVKENDGEAMEAFAVSVEDIKKVAMNYEF